MDWQAVAAILITLLCGASVAHHWLRPLWQRQGPLCTLCSQCSNQCTGQCGPAATASEELLQVGHTGLAPPAGPVHGPQHPTS